jgi:hypothetical protein
MMGAWISFIHRLVLDPTSCSEIVLSWPDHRNARQNMVFAADASYIEDSYRRERIEFWTKRRVLDCVEVPVGLTLSLQECLGGYVLTIFRC